MSFNDDDPANNNKIFVKEITVIPSSKYLQLAVSDNDDPEQKEMESHIDPKPPIEEIHAEQKDPVAEKFREGIFQL
jgi:hypothetical protein